MSQKLENLLNLALETPEGIREQTEALNVGFDAAARTWELIVKYHGDLKGLASLGIRTEELLAGYAILTVPEQLVETVAALEQIEYVEKPKRYYYSDGREPYSGSGRKRCSYGDPELRSCGDPELRSCVDPELHSCVSQDLGSRSCILPITLRRPYLTGRGVLIAILDSGIDYRRADFLDSSGNTRILFLWDQTLQPREGQDAPPEGFSLGVEYDSARINEALKQAPSASVPLPPLSIDTDGHGTAVAGIAAASAPSYEGVAPESSLLIVKLGPPDRLGFPWTTEIMRGVTYAIRKSLLLGMPLVINLSFGNSYGPHDGSSLLERFLDNAAEIGRTCICVGSGNEGNSAGHTAGNTAERTRVDLAVDLYERDLSIQLWKHYTDQFRIRLRSPGGVLRELPDTLSPTKFTLRMEQTLILVYLGEPTPYSVDQEIYFELLPASAPFINNGIWQIQLEPLRTVTGQYSLYLPGSAVRSTGTGFTSPTPQATLTIPSTASRLITVGAYDSAYDSYADFSGRGFPNIRSSISAVNAGSVKPDLVAPGVNIPAPDLYAGYRPFTGTSFATPVVSGCAALLMQWGIIQGNDPFLYGEKLKAYLRSGAQPIRSETIYPNDRAGFGALCLASSFPDSVL